MSLIPARVDLDRGDRLNLGFRTLGIGLGWDIESGASQFEHDLDAWAFLLTGDGQVPNENYVVFYNNLTSPDGAVQLSSDHRLGQAPKHAGFMTACEILVIDLEKLDPIIEQIIFVVGIYKAEQRTQTFGQVRDSFIRIQDPAKGQDICRYELHDDFSLETAVEFGRLHRNNGEWTFEASGIGLEGGTLAAVKTHARNYVENPP